MSEATIIECVRSVCTAIFLCALIGAGTIILLKNFNKQKY